MEQSDRPHQDLRHHLDLSTIQQLDLRDHHSNRDAQLASDKAIVTHHHSQSLSEAMIIADKSKLIGNPISKFAKICDEPRLRAR